MPPFSPKTAAKLHIYHRWGGLLAAGFIIFYSLSGILLNHRQDLGYFQEKSHKTIAVQPTDLQSLNSFIDTYKKQINRQDSPKVIRIKENNTIEFLYGSHGKTTYVIKPLLGRMEIIEKNYLEPWHWLNNLHKAWQTNNSWLILSDLITVVIIITTVTGLLILRYRPLEIILASSGVLLLILGGACQW